MKFMTVTVLCAVAAAAMGASLSPKNEAAELLLETAQLDSSITKSQDSEQQKRSFGSAFNSYSPAYGYEEAHVPNYPASSGADLWGFKRAILGALNTAIRAIAGGSIAVKGQVIKGAGNLVAAQGRLVANGGQAVADFGRGVAVRALHSAPKIATYHAAPAPVAYATHGYVSPAPAAYASHANYIPAAPAGYVSAAPAYYRQQDGVISSIQKAKLAKLNVVTSVGGAVGHAVSGAAGAVAGAVGTAAAGAARLATGVAHGAANIVSGAAHGAANIAVGAADVVGNHVAHKINSFSPAPAVIPAVGYKAAYAVPTYGGSLEDSFGQFDDSYKYNADPLVSIQPSISYNLH